MIEELRFGVGADGRLWLVGPHQFVAGLDRVRWQIDCERLKARLSPERAMQEALGLQWAEWRRGDHASAKSG